MFPISPLKYSFSDENSGKRVYYFHKKPVTMISCSQINYSQIYTN